MKLYMPGKAPDSYSIEEYCPYCDNMIPIDLEYPADAKGSINYEQECPVCGMKLMICTTCHDDEFECDWTEIDENYGHCKMMKGAKK